MGLIKPMSKKNFKNILIVRTDRIGDFLLNIPLILNLKMSFPQSKITAIVSESIDDLTKNIPYVDEFIVFNSKFKNMLGKLRLVNLLMHKKFDLAIISNPSKEFNWIVYLSGIPNRVGYDRKSSFLLTHKIKDAKNQGIKHEIEYNLDLLKPLGINSRIVNPFLVINKQDRQFTKDMLNNNGLDLSKKNIVIQSQSSNLAKNWPKEYFANLADKLIEELDANIIFIGSKEECEKVDQILSLMRNKALNLSGKINLNQLAGLLKRADLLVTNDSGPMHIAACVGTPIVAIFGRNIPGVSARRWGPWGKNNAVLHKDLNCNPCLDNNCSYQFRCLKLISSAEVFDACVLKLREINHG